MITIVGVYDKGWFGRIERGRKTDFALYRQTAQAYGVEFYMLEELEAEKWNQPVVLFDEEGNTSLEDFQHPETATYVFGRSGQDVKRYVDSPVACVRIDTPYDTPLFGHVADANSIRLVNGAPWVIASGGFTHMSIFAAADMDVTVWGLSGVPGP